MYGQPFDHTPNYRVENPGAYYNQERDYPNAETRRFEMMMEDAGLVPFSDRMYRRHRAAEIRNDRSDPWGRHIRWG